MWTMLDRMFQSGIKTPVAIFANAAITLKGRDGRAFSVDREGRWVNRQRKATFVSPTIHAARYETVKQTVLDHWCHSYTPRPADVVFDVGAGVGDEAVIFSHMAGHVYAVEAHPTTFACLQRTVDLSKTENVTSLPFAIVDRDGEISISSAAHISNSVLNGGDIQVMGRSIASLCAEIGIDRIDFLKMNIEGAERRAVRGLGAVDIRHLAISCHDFITDAGGDPNYRTLDEVEQFLISAGYRVTKRANHPYPPTRYILYADKA